VSLVSRVVAEEAVKKSNIYKEIVSGDISIIH
jgi:hypothetical protein